MLLRVIRNLECSNESETRGNLYVDGRLFCNTIEPPYGYASGPATGNLSPATGNHSKGHIPCGWYRVRVTYSPRFKRQMPLLYMVPGFEGIRIHAGLRVENTQGCICVGERWKEDHLTKLLTEAQNRHEEIYICVTDKDHVDSELPNRPDPYKNCIGY